MSVIYTPIIKSGTITVSHHADLNLITSIIPEPFMVTDSQWESDIHFSSQEFYYLTDIKIGESLSYNHLKRGISHLFAKKCFESISITIHDDNDGKKISFFLQGLWRFDTLKVSGVWVGKDWYKHYYLMEPGDPFDHDKHHHSIQKMIEACKKDGFFDVEIKNNLIRNHKTKLITVQTIIDKGWRFSIDQVSLAIDGDEGILHHDIALLKRSIYKKFLHRRHFGKYAKSTLEHQARAIKNYLMRRGFLLAMIDLTETVHHKKKKVQLQWHISLGKKRKFVFIGACFFSYKQLFNRLLQFGRSAWIVPASILADELKDMYRAKGFWDITIEASDEPKGATFSIQEGKRAAIKEVVLEDEAFALPKRHIKQCFKKVKRHTFFDQALFDDVCEQLIDTYRRCGLLDAKIMHHEYQQIDSALYTLKLKVMSGEQVVIETIDIPGFESLLMQGPFRLFHKKKKPIFYDPALIELQKRWLSDHFRAKGYLFASIESEVVNDENNKKKLMWHIKPGNSVRFGKTIIQGSSTFPFAKIMRELEYNQADVWNSQKVRQSLVRLKEKRIFDSLSFAPLAILSDQDERPIMLKFHNDDPFEVRVRTGLEFQHIRQYQTFGGLTYKLGGTFIVKNPSNSGDYFQFDGDVARSHREIRFTYFYPWLFNTPLGGIFKAYGIRYEQPGFIGTKKNIYTIFGHGFLMGLQYKKNYIDAALNVGFEVGRTRVGNDKTTRRMADALACAIDFSQRLLNKRIPFLFIEPTLLIDHLDNNLNPSKGMLTLISLKGMFPTSRAYTDSYFLKLLIEHSFFVPIAQAVAAFRIRFGHIFHRCFSDIMPNERFYLGGSHSVRSYEADLAPPLGCFIGMDGKQNIVPRGGKTMINLNAELRLPVFNKFGIVIFQDFGMLSGDDFIGFNEKNIVGGSGCGIRYFTPIGPLRFDIAWKWRKQLPQEHDFNWYITFGQAF